jgi:hypothetical protein
MLAVRGSIPTQVPPGSYKILGLWICQKPRRGIRFCNGGQLFPFSLVMQSCCPCPRESRDTSADEATDWVSLSFLHSESPMPLDSPQPTALPSGHLTLTSVADRRDRIFFALCHSGKKSTLSTYLVYLFVVTTNFFFFFFFCFSGNVLSLLYFYFFFIFLLLFICAYKAWFISPP